MDLVEQPSKKSELDFQAYIENELEITLEQHSILRLNLGGLGFEGGERHYYALPENLKNHRVGQLMKHYVKTHDPEYIEQAAKMLMNLGARSMQALMY